MALLMAAAPGAVAAASPFAPSSSAPSSKIGDFLAPAGSARAGVAASTATGLKPPSEPRIAIGPGLRPDPPFHTFSQ